MKLPRFSLRDLFWLVLVCALAVGWWVESAGLRRQIRDVNEKFEETSERMRRLITF